MIPVRKENPELRGPNGLLEDCVFCGFPTEFWHEKTNNPCCRYCAKIHTVPELTDNVKIGKQAEKIRLKVQKEKEQFMLESAKYKLKKLGIKVYHQKYMGDDMYSWAVFRSDKPYPVVTGLHWRELSHYKVELVNKILKEKGLD